MRASPVVVALGSNLLDRALMLRRAVRELRGAMNLVRMSSVYETAAADAPAGSPDFLNMVVAGWTGLGAQALIEALQEIEGRLGRVRRGRNAPRTIDLDLILYGAHLIRTRTLTVPHPRYLQREFVMRPLRELALPWVDPVSGVRLG